jgi:hypothetical protein
MDCMSGSCVRLLSSNTGAKIQVSHDHHIAVKFSLRSKTAVNSIKILNGNVYPCRSQ